MSDSKRKSIFQLCKEEGYTPEEFQTELLPSVVILGQKILSENEIQDADDYLKWVVVTDKGDFEVEFPKKVALILVSD